MQKGLVHIYTGDGKGKTTAATGLIVRALGHGQRVLLARFLKPEKPESGEIRLLREQPGLTILTAGVGVIDRRPEKQVIVDSVVGAFGEASERVMTGEYDLAVFDEINNAMHNEYIPVSEVESLLRNRPGHVNLVLTGRNAPVSILEQADLVTSMEKVRHPFDSGIPARRGLEF